MNQPSDEIKSKLDIVDVIRDYIPLQAAGANFRAPCPFHREKTPSFMVSPEKQIWHCFGCSKGGDIFSFVMEMEGLSFIEALRLLATKAGVTLRRQDPKLTSQRNRLLDINELCRRYYHKMFMESDQAEPARKYLISRGLKDETIEEWQIGYSLDSWDNVLNLLKKKGYAENEIFLAGIVIKGQNRPGFYDRFRGRIMFPINDINGNTVAFTARVSPDREETEKLGKYINSPQTMIYNKSKILFGLDKARMEIKKREFAIIVEGQMDAITAHQHGYKNTVASSSTALTKEHVHLLKRYSPNVYLAFDMDEAGRLAVDRGAREAMAAEMNIKVIEMPAGKDPDECIRKDPEGWGKAVKEARPVMEHYFNQALAGLDLGNIEHQRQAVKALLPIIAKLGNIIERDYWLKKLGEAVHVAENLLRETMIKYLQSKRDYGQIQEQNTGQDKEPKKQLSRVERLSELLLALILKFPALSGYLTNQIQTDQIKDEGNRAIYKNLIFYYNNIINNPAADVEWKADSFGYHDFRQWILNQTDNDKNGNQPLILDKLALLGDKEFADFHIERARDEAIKIAVFLKKHYLSDRMREVERMIAGAEEARDEQTARELMAELKILADEMRGLEE